MYITWNALLPNKLIHKGNKFFFSQSGWPEFLLPFLWHLRQPRSHRGDIHHPENILEKQSRLIGFCTSNQRIHQPAHSKSYTLGRKWENCNELVGKSIELLTVHIFFEKYRVLARPKQKGALHCHFCFAECPVVLLVGFSFFSFNVIQSAVC